MASISLIRNGRDQSEVGGYGGPCFCEYASGPPEAVQALVTSQFSAATTQKICLPRCFATTLRLPKVLTNAGFRYLRNALKPICLGRETLAYLPGRIACPKTMTTVRPRRPFRVESFLTLLPKSTSALGEAGGGCVSSGAKNTSNTVARWWRGGSALASVWAEARRRR